MSVITIKLSLTLGVWLYLSPFLPIPDLTPCPSPRKAHSKTLSSPIWPSSSRVFSALHPTTSNTFLEHPFLNSSDRPQRKMRGVSCSRSSRPELSILSRPVSCEIITNNHFLFVLSIHSSPGTGSCLLENLWASFFCEEKCPVALIPLPPNSRRKVPLVHPWHREMWPCLWWKVTLLPALPPVTSQIVRNKGWGLCLCKWG